MKFDCTPVLLIRHIRSHLSWSHPPQRCGRLAHPSPRIPRVARHHVAAYQARHPTPATEHPKTKCQLTTRGKWNRNTLHWQTVQALPANKGIRRVRPPFSLARRKDLELPLFSFFLPPSPPSQFAPKVKCRLIWSEWVRGRWEQKDVTEKRTEPRYTPLISSMPWLPFARSAEPYREPSMKCCKELILSRLCRCLERSTAYWDEYILAGSARKIDRLSTAHLRAMGENQATAQRAQHQ